MSSSTGSPAASRPPRPADEREAGFTLFEAVVAFTVAALVMTALFQLLSRDMQAVARIDDTTRAALAAEAKLEGLGISEPLVPGTAAGRIDDRFVWRTKVDALGTSRRAGSGDLPVSLYRVSVTVSWDGGARSVSLDGLKLQ